MDENSKFIRANKIWVMKRIWKRIFIFDKTCQLISYSLLYELSIKHPPEDPKMKATKKKEEEVETLRNRTLPNLNV